MYTPWDFMASLRMRNLRASVRRFSTWAPDHWWSIWALTARKAPDSRILLSMVFPALSMIRPLKASSIPFAFFARVSETIWLTASPSSAMLRA
ncbi:hypothetical protein BDZ91DRAFT_709314 [Kalaharituber pfeilii]|nr:hypothetical protein BDZ91DRAFT_709314 [Kalaharituber pfeilii]